MYFGGSYYKEPRIVCAYSIWTMIRHNSAITSELCSAVRSNSWNWLEIIAVFNTTTVTTCCRFEYLNFLFHTCAVMGLEWSVLSSRVNKEIFSKTVLGVGEVCFTKNMHSAGN